MVAKVAVIGIGNTLAGDDGAGIAVVRLLEQRWGGHPAVVLRTLEGDLFGVSDLLEAAKRIVFVDAVAGTAPGAIVVERKYRRSFSPSFHQTDISSVMHCLKTLAMAEPFPQWEVWGIVVAPPRELKIGLNPEIEMAAEVLASRLDKFLEQATS